MCIRQLSRQSLWATTGCLLSRLARSGTWFVSITPLLKVDFLPHTAGIGASQFQTGNLSKSLQNHMHDSMIIQYVDYMIAFIVPRPNIYNMSRFFETRSGRFARPFLVSYDRPRK